MFFIRSECVQNMQHAPSDDKMRVCPFCRIGSNDTSHTGRCTVPWSNVYIRNGLVKFLLEIWQFVDHEIFNERGMTK